ncbi:MAG: endonuclease III [Proteobacteria bacterium]|nr:endonuclease III [Pseudomonadota bacterium]
MQRKRITAVLKALEGSYPRGERPWAVCSNPFRTLIGTILSAQTTDAQVDLVTPELFRRWPTPVALSRAKVAEVQRIIKSVGLHRAKARNIVAAARAISERFDGKVPAARDGLMSLAGVGRKTANVVLIKSFGVPAMPVDTHVFRVATRIGLAEGKTPEQAERGLVKVIPERQLGAAHFWLIHHGRTLCHARNPECVVCPVRKYCFYFKKQRSREVKKLR